MVCAAQLVEHGKVALSFLPGETPLRECIEDRRGKRYGAGGVPCRDLFLDYLIEFRQGLVKDVEQVCVHENEAVLAGECVDPVPSGLLKCDEEIVDPSAYSQESGLVVGPGREPGYDEVTFRAFVAERVCGFRR